MENGNQIKNIITAKGVYKSFATGDRYTNVLRNIDLEVREGETLIIFGPSGCGKSTLLHVAMGIERPDAGTIKLEGMDLWKLSAKDRANIRKRELGIMYQQQNWIRSLSVEENIAFSGQLIGLEKEEAVERAREVLKVVGMDFRTNYVPSELSAGEQQKIGLARALMTNPRIIIADEPTGNLDVESGQEMIDLLTRLSKSGKTVIMVTHNPEYLKYGDRVMLMLDGKIRRELVVTEENAEEVQREITRDLKSFIEGGVPTANKDGKIPIPMDSNEDMDQQNIIERLKYGISFNLRFLFQSFMFLILILLNSLGKKINFFKKLADNFRSYFAKVMRKLDRNLVGKISSSINTIDLTEISFRNLWVKKSRTSITILGMSIGIGFIVFLLSLGYGLERLVITEITRIEDMRQVDIAPTVSSNVVLNTDNVEIISSIEGVENVYPLINLAARVQYEEASTDVVVYGVQEEYLVDSPINITEGEVFSNSNLGVVVNEEFLTTIGLEPSQVLGEKLTLDLVLSELVEIEELEETEENEETEAPNFNKEYVITGVVADSNPAIVYMPIMELEDYNITEFSQLRISIDSEDRILEVRKQIEVLGFTTTSVMDTVSEVENFFSYARIALSIIGVIALSIAILGMFNTLTVSLLERTREVGLMKTIGMGSNEIRSLFINESMIMGITGGMLGILFGVLMGLVLSVILSVIAITRGGSFIVVNSLPLYIIIGIVVVSTFVGFLTGLYPSSRAVKMAPLDALRYE
jgi:ABC-type lipoprotein export system ATPase subunit/ABC-type antimicrobial peptide transport system permease subunit